MKRLLIATPLLAGLLAGATACNSAAQGQAQPQPVVSTPTSPNTVSPSKQPSTTASSSSQRHSGRGRLTDIDACKLITQQEGQKYQINRVERVDLGGARGCFYYTADSEFVLGTGIRERQGIDEFNEDYGKATNTRVGSYPAKQQIAVGGGCVTAIGFTESSRIDVDLSAAGVDQDRACQLSREFAVLVASKVTPG
ncbi:MAG: DUF3558 family protein [Sciscionella sp.]